MLAFAKTTATAPLICPTEHKWNGGTPLPLDTYHGSCYCGNDKYCMCTPSLAIDAIIEVKNNRKGRVAGIITTPSTITTAAVTPAVVTSLPPPVVPAGAGAGAGAGVLSVPAVPVGPVASVAAGKVVPKALPSSLLTSSSGRYVGAIVLCYC